MEHKQDQNDLRNASFSCLEKVKTLGKEAF
jgi:hypothetical protein